MSLFANSEQVSKSCERYIVDLRKLYEFHSLRVGSPSDFLQLAPKLAASEGFRLDLSDLARIIRDKEQGRLSATDMITMAGIGIGGEAIASQESELSESAGPLLALLAGVGGWRHTSETSKPISENPDMAHPPASLASAPRFMPDNQQPDTPLDASPIAEPEPAAGKGRRRDGNGRKSRPEPVRATTSANDVSPEMRETLARLELASMQLKVYLDDIDRRMGRIEPHIENITALIHSSTDFLDSARSISGEPPPESGAEARAATEPTPVARRHSEGSMAAAMDLASKDLSSKNLVAEQSPLPDDPVVAEPSISEAQAPSPDKKPPIPPSDTRSGLLPAAKPVSQPAILAPNRKAALPDPEPASSPSRQGVPLEQKKATPPASKPSKANASENLAVALASAARSAAQTPGQNISKPGSSSIETPSPKRTPANSIPFSPVVWSGAQPKTTRLWLGIGTAAVLLLATGMVSYHFLPRRSDNGSAITERQEAVIRSGKDLRQPGALAATAALNSSRPVLPVRTTGLSLAARPQELRREIISHPQGTSSTRPQSSPDRRSRKTRSIALLATHQQQPPPAAQTSYPSNSAPARLDEKPSQGTPQSSHLEEARAESAPLPSRIGNPSPQPSPGPAPNSQPKDKTLMAATSSPLPVLASAAAGLPPGDIPRPTVKGPVLPATSDIGVLLSAPPPTYPQEARQLGIQGKVVVEVTVDKNGIVKRTRAVSGPYLLQAPAQESVRRRRYAPLLRDGDPIEFRTLVTINYHLNE